jgi:hypothetical protein
MDGTDSGAAAIDLTNVAYLPSKCCIEKAEGDLIGTIDTQ